jgi:hypothetical protein
MTDAALHQTPDLTDEQRLLIAMRRTLAAIVRDLAPAPGMRQPLREETVEDIRRCLALIAARERDLAQTQGRGGERPHYADEPAAAVVPMDQLRRRPN